MSIFGQMSERNLSNSSTDSFHMIPDDRSPPLQFNTQQKIYEQLPNYKEQIKSISNKTTNNVVEFYSDKPIQENDLDTIMLYLENLRRSNGGEYEEYNLDSKRRILSVNFKENSTKLRVLANKTIKINLNQKEFNLIANEPIDFDSFELNKNVIILKNIDITAIPRDLLNLYAENLVINDDESNEVASIIQSDIQPMTIYIKYKDEFDPNMIQKRYEQRPILNKIPIEFKPAYKTKIALVKSYDRNGNEIPREIIEMHFSNRRRCGGESYLSIHEREPFLLLSYNSQEACEVICSQKHEEMNLKFIVEPLYNYNIFESEFRNLDFNRIQANVFKDEPVQNSQIKNECPIFKIDSVQEPKLKVFKIFDSTYFTEFESELLDRQASFSLREIGDNIELISVCTHELPNNEIEYIESKRRWEEDIASFIQIYFQQFNIKQVTIKYPEQTIPKLVLDTHKVNLIPTSDKNVFEIIGFTDLVDRLVKDIQINDVPPMPMLLVSTPKPQMPPVLTPKPQMPPVLTPKPPMPPVSDQVIEDYIKHFQAHEIRILIIERYISLVRERHAKMVIEINIIERVVTLRGTRNQIDDAKKIAFDIIGRIVHEDVPTEVMKIKFFLNRENDVLSWLRNNNVLCVLVPDQDSELIRVYSTQRSEIKKCLNMLESEIKFIAIDHEKVASFKDFQIETFIRSHRYDEGVMIDSEFGNVYICGFTSKANDLFREFFAALA